MSVLLGLSRVIDWVNARIAVVANCPSEIKIEIPQINMPPLDFGPPKIE
jgi:hypothetical protein